MPLLLLPQRQRLTSEAALPVSVVHSLHCQCKNGKKNRTRRCASAIPVPRGRDNCGQKMPRLGAGQKNDHHSADTSAIATVWCSVTNGDGHHLHVRREQIVACVRAVLGGAVEEEISVESLAHHATVHVREAHDHRVDRAACTPGSQQRRKHGRYAERTCAHCVSEVQSAMSHHHHNRAGHCDCCV